jgi:hypothetical protein
MIVFSNRDKFNQCDLDDNYRNLEVDDNDDVRIGSALRNFDTLSVSDVYLNGENSSISKNDDILLTLESMDGRVKRSKNMNNLDDSVKSAAKITKNMFDTTNTKLSMQIFETFNIGTYF